jgi:MoxR-like ATPase
MQYNSDVQAIDDFVEKYKLFKKEIAKVITGQEQVVKNLIISIFGQGHCLLIGVPGLAKTLLVTTVAKTLGLSYKRIQFTPDLMPSDVIGTNIYNMQNSEFEFKSGPIFSNIIFKPRHKI